MIAMKKRKKNLSHQGKCKSMAEIMQNAPRLEIEEAVQIIEVCLHAHEEPYTYDQACGKEEWRKTMNEEI